MLTTAELSAMARALQAAALSPVGGANPQVGCVIVKDQQIVAVGTHQGAGTPHAEVVALRLAGEQARGATAVVTLEPCNHTGRTGPCSQALIEAGVAKVIYAQDDPNPEAAGGATTLRLAGLTVVGGVADAEATLINEAWTVAVTRARPHVLWKYAATLDGRSAAADGTSRWVSSVAARQDTHRLRAQCDTMLIGSNTVAVDNPQLTVRDGDDQPLPHQPLRVVMGQRDLDPASRIFDDVPGAPKTLHLATRDPHEALAQLYDAGSRRIFLEGGPTLAAAFLSAGLIDQVVAYIAPKFLGAGTQAVADLGITTIRDALDLQLASADVVGEGVDANVRLELTRPTAGSHERPQGHAGWHKTRSESVHGHH